MRAAWCLVLAGCDGVLGLAPTVAADAADLVLDPACPTTYVHVPPDRPGGDYRFSDGTTAVAFRLAEAQCEADRIPGARFTHLVVFESLAEQDTVFNFAVANAPTTLAARWVGLSDISSSWRWITDEPGLLAPPQPGTTPRDWGALLDDGTYYAYDASASSLPYICECDEYPGVAGTY